MEGEGERTSESVGTKKGVTKGDRLNNLGVPSIVPITVGISETGRETEGESSPPLPSI